MSLTASQHGPFLKGVDATSGAFHQPKGTVPRSSNLCGIARGALATIDGSSVLAWYNGAIQSGFDKFLALDVFEPSGVQSYYLALVRSPIHLGTPFNVAASDGGAGGSLVPGHTYAWVITALDGVGGETNVAATFPFFAEGGTSHKVILTWNGMPNAFAYNVYRMDNTLGGPFQLLSSSSLPVPQSSGTVPMSFTFTDDGSAAIVASIAISSATVISPYPSNTAQFTTVSPNGYKVGQSLQTAGISPSYFNGFVSVTRIVNSTTFIGTVIFGFLPSSGTGSGGTVSATVPVADNTTQTALVKIPASSTPPTSWSNANVVALFPASIASLGTPIVGGSSTAPQSNTLIQASPSGLVPFTQSIIGIQGQGGGQSNIQFNDAPPPGLSIGDTITVSGTVNYNQAYTIAFIGPSDLVVNGEPSNTLETAGTVQYELVQVSTYSSFTAASGSNQTIAFAANAAYNGTFFVRQGGSGTVFIVTIPGASVLPASGGGTFGAAGAPPGATPSGPAYSTVNGGILGLVSPIPQMAQFTNRMILALGNGVPPYYYPDSTGTLVNPAVTALITAMTVTSPGSGSFGLYIQVTTASAHGLSVGGSTVISGVTPSQLNGVAVVEQIVSTTVFNAWLYVPSSSFVYSSGGISTQSAQPLPNNYVVSYPKWTASTVVEPGTVWQPLTQPGAADIFLTCVQGGTTGTVEPAWIPVPATGQVFPAGAVSEASSTVIWEESGYLLSSNPPPPGAAHLAVYSECLFLLNTSPTNTLNGIDGPTVLRQSNPGDPLSWNPASLAFLDKDDGSEGMGLGTYTIAAVGIPPEGSLFAFKNYSTYQITGLFGAGIQIQRVKTERGCNAPRTILFAPGFGVARMTHLGISVVDGVEDRVISDPVRPYLFTVNDSTVADITPADPVWLPLSSACLTANPPMYNCFIPVGTGGSSGGALTRSLSFDLVQKAFYPVDFPFTIGTTTQVLLTGSPPVTLLSGFQDGLIQRWQYGDEQWLTGSAVPSQVAWSYRTPVTSGKNPDQRLYCDQIYMKGINTHSLGPVTCTVTVDGAAHVPRFAVTDARPNSGDFLMTFSVQVTGNRFYADIGGTGGVEIDGDDFHVVPKKLGGRLVIA